MSSTGADRGTPLNLRVRIRPARWATLGFCGLICLWSLALGGAGEWAAGQTSSGGFLPEFSDVIANPITEPNPSQQDLGGLSEGELLEFFNAGPEEWSSPRGLSSSIQIMILLTVLTLAPSILLMTTCFVRIIVVLGLLRQAIGAQQLPPSQVITSLAIFMTILVMAPVWQEVKDQAIIPYIDQEGTPLSLEEAVDRGVQPLKRFMSRQIALAENTDDIWLFFRYLPPEERQKIPETWNDVPLKVLLPAFMISELKISFLIGFQIYLPFLVIDLVVSSLAISMGMMMLPPVIISLPFKLILFVLVDGWHLVVGMLMDSFAPYS
jgi:flagellar biosynthetic protein FliP